MTHAHASVARLAGLPALVAAVAALSGCAMLGAPPEGPREQAPPPPADAPATASAACQVVEFNPLAEEVVEERERVLGDIRFCYGGSPRAIDALAAAAPDVVFVLAHGWMNDVASSREFTAALAKGVLARAAQDGAAPAKVGLLALHWDSKRAIFHESALAAEVIGKRRVAPLLGALQARLPAAKVVLVGHSLGGRMVLATLNGAGTGATTLAHAAVLLEAAADADALLPEKAHDSFGCFPLAPSRAGVIFNVFSGQDEVLRLAYANALRAPAIGREGAQRAFQERFATIKLPPGGLDDAALKGIRDDALTLYPGTTDRRVVNVDATAVVTGHSEVMIAPIFDLAWRAAR